MAESAYSEVLAAVIDANVSGRDVPKATIVMAVTDSLSPISHPKTVASSAMMNVTPPM